MAGPSPTVLVVGAGPVGLVAAAELARHQVAVRIIDKRAAATEESRAIAVHARSLDMFDRMGVAQELLDTGVTARGMELYSNGRRLFRVPLDQVDAAYPFSLNTPQTETERILTAHLASLGVTVERSVELMGLSQDPESVRVSLRRADGAEEQLSVAWVVGADGARSTVRHLVGGKLAGSFVGERFLLGDVDARHNLDPEMMYTFFSPAGPVLAMPLRHGRMRVMAQVHDRRGAPMPAQPTLSELQAVVDDRVGGIELQHAHWLTSFELHHAHVDQYRWGRIFLAGDAAHIHSPAGGQGMNTGMQDAFNLAWKLAAATHGGAGNALLNSYHAERHPVATSMIATTERLSRGGTLTGPPQHLRNTLLKALSHVTPLTRAMANWAAEMSVHYRNSPVVQQSRAPRGTTITAGDHFPYLGDNAVHDELRSAWGRGHTLLTVAGGHAVPRPTQGQCRQVLITFTGTPVNGYDVALADNRQVTARRLGLSNGGVVVVRPDGYVGAIAALGDQNTVTDYFTALLR